jgi:hypothetical protein
VTDAVPEIATGVTAAAEQQSTADLWFDPTCPYTWRTSRWLVDVADRRGLSVSFHPMSLARLRSDSDSDSDSDTESPSSPASEPEPPDEGTAALRALVAAEQASGQEGLGRLYTLLGTRKHDGGQTLTVDTIRQAVHDAGLPDSVGAAVEDPTFDRFVAISHEQGQARAGMTTGSPILALGPGRGYFGPVLTELPREDDALRLFEAVRLLASVPSFSEIKTSRG